MTKCLNCSHQFKGNFCSNCGQKASVKRLTAAELLKDSVHFITHLESGFIFTTRNFLFSPGITSLNYISGKRKIYQSPVSFFLIWTGLFFLLHNAIINHFHFQLTSELVQQMNNEEEANILFRQHFTLFLIPVIFTSALLIYYFMAKPHFNFTEVLTLSIYGAGIYFMMSFISDFIFGICLRVNLLTSTVFLWQGILSTTYNFWFNFDLFKRLQLRLFWLRLISVSILIAVSGWVIMFYLPMAWISLTGILR